MGQHQSHFEDVFPVNNPSIPHCLQMPESFQGKPIHSQVWIEGTILFFWNTTKALASQTVSLIKVDWGTDSNLLVKSLRCDLEICAVAVDVRSLGCGVKSGKVRDREWRKQENQSGMADDFHFLFHVSVGPRLCEF